MSDPDPVTVLNAEGASPFVLLCEQVGVDPMLSVFRYLFSICSQGGWYYFKHHAVVLPGAGGAVVEERPQRVEAEPALERRGGQLLLRVRRDQRGVQGDDHLAPGLAGDRALTVPHP